MPSVAREPLGRRPRVSLKQVAEHAGCGVTTVSDILNRNIVGKYPPETRARVFQAMRRTGYTPSRAAQKLRGTRSKEVGLVLTRTFDNPFFARLTHEFQVHLRQMGYRTQLQITGQDLWSLSRFPTELLSDDVDAVILGPVYHSDHHHLQALSVFADTGLPVLLFGGPCGSGFEEHVFPHYEAGRLAGQALADAGHRRVVFLGAGEWGEPDRQITKEDGVRDALARVDGHLTTVSRTDTDNYGDFYQLAGTFARAWRQQPAHLRATGVVCRNDQMAMAAMAAFADHGLSIPADISIVGTDNVPEAQVVRPGLSTVDFRLPEHVSAMVARVVARLEERLPTTDPPAIAPRLVLRESIASVRS